MSEKRQIATNREDRRATEALIVEMARLGYSATEIHQALLERDQAGSVPHLRTIQRYVKAKAPPLGDTWSPAYADEDDAQLILPVVGYLIWKTQGRVRSVSKGVATWIARIRRMAPDLMTTHLDPMAKVVFLLASDYEERTRTRQSTEDLDCYLAYGPWRGETPEEREAPIPPLSESGWEMRVMHEYWQDSWAGMIANGRVPEPLHWRLVEQLNKPAEEVNK